MSIEQPLTPSALVCLTLCARWDADALQRLRGLGAGGPPDWDGAARFAIAEGVAPLVYHTLREAGLALPASAQAALRAAYYCTAQRNLLLARELETALGALEAAGVATILLKGAALTQSVYINPALRPMGDLDLLVQPQDIPAALDALIALGYHNTSPEARPGDAAKFENELLLQRPEPDHAPIELHWSLFDAPFYQHRLPIERFWETAQPVQVGAASTRVLCPPSQILHLCGHLLLHHRASCPLATPDGAPQGRQPRAAATPPRPAGGAQTGRLLWLYDIAELALCHRERLDWPLVCSQASDCALVCSLQHVLPQVSALFPHAIGREVLSMVQTLRPEPHEARLVARLLAPRRPVLQRFWTDLAGMRPWRRRLAYAWRSLFPSPRYMQERYRISRRVLTPLYYPYRWLRGLAETLAPGRRKPG